MDWKILIFKESVSPKWFLAVSSMPQKETARSVNSLL